MNWDQIENSWAAMTRRVRPDLPGSASSGSRSLLSPTNSDDLPPEALDAPDQTKSQSLVPVPIQIA